MCIRPELPDNNSSLSSINQSSVPNLRFKQTLFIRQKEKGNSYCTMILEISAILFPLLLLLLFLFKAYNKKQTPLEFTCKQTGLNVQICSDIRTSVGEYSAPWYYFSFLSLIKWGKNHRLKYQREIFHHSDGTQFEVDWYPNAPTMTNNNDKEVCKICLHFPGLGTSSDSKVSQGFALEMSSHGMFVAVMVPRGKETPLRTGRLWHAGCTDDALFLLLHIASIFDKTKIQILLVGYSASTNIICKSLLTLLDDNQFKTFNNNILNIKKNSSAQHTRNGFNLSKNCTIVAAVCLSVTYDYVRTRTTAEKTFLGFILSLLLCNKYKNFIKRNPQVHHLMDQECIKRVMKCYFVSQYDKVAYPLLGYASEQNQYDHYSAFDIRRMCIPFLAMQPRDDFIQGGDVRGNTPLDKYTESVNTIYMETQRGNHLGFFEGTGFFDAFSNTTSYTYPARVAAQFFKTIIEYKA